jgi:tetratricopeptide (TPR) repeat protein
VRRILLLALPLIAVAALVASADDEKTDAPVSANLKIPASVSPERRTKLEEAIAAWKAAETKFGQDFNKAGNYHAARADLDGAAKLLRARIAEDPSDPLPLYYLGILFQLQTDDKHAVETLGRVVALNPKFHEAWAELGDAHAHRAEYKDAENAYAKAIELKPDYVPALRGRALERMDAGRFSEAREDVKRGLDVEPKDLYLVFAQLKLKVAIEGPSWPIKFEKETEHYIVKTDVDQPFADWISGQLELIRKLYVKVFEKTKIDLPKRKYTVIVYANAKEYHANGGPEGAGGHYDPEIRQLFLFRYPKNEDLQLVLFHEAFHQFLHPYLQRAPQWFNEGFGDYFGATKYVRVPEEGMRIQPNPWRLGKVKEAINDGTAHPLKDLLLMSRAELYDKATVGMNYAQAWSFIYFLCEYDDRRYFPVLGKYFNALRAGKDQDEAYKAAFGSEDMKKIQEEWKQYILRLN